MDIQGIEPWQCGLANISERVRALSENGNFTDISLTFPGTEIIYDAHRLILAISSPVFEHILYDWPMDIEGRDVLLHGDDPLMMRHVIDHCYGYDPDILDMDTALGVYKLADKYILNILKQECCQHIVNYMSLENNNAVIEFAERFYFTDLKSYCLPLLKEKFEEAMICYEEIYKEEEVYEENQLSREEDFEDEPDNTACVMLMGYSDSWIEGLLLEVKMKILDFQRSWKNPESPLQDNRLRTILSSEGCHLEKFYGCINAECIQQFPMGANVTRYIYDNNTVDALELFLSVTDTHHAKRVIEAINQQNRFESNLIAIHIRCEEVWPINWSPIRPERTHRPSILLISDADDDKTAWIIAAVKAFLPQCEGSYNKVFRQFNRYEGVPYSGDDISFGLKPVNILCLPRSNFTPNGFINLLQELSISGINCNKICFGSPYISNAHAVTISKSLKSLKHRGFNPRLQLCQNIFRRVFDFIPKQYTMDQNLN